MQVVEVDYAASDEQMVVGNPAPAIQETIIERWPKLNAENCERLLAPARLNVQRLNVQRYSLLSARLIDASLCSHQSIALRP
jgi:hypothetical protein